MKSVVIVAGGAGSRMNSTIPKQFLEIYGKPIIVWTIEKFISFDPQIQLLLVLPENHMLYWQDLSQKFPVVKKATITAGGISRFHSVVSGLTLVHPDSLVGIHDAVRPLVSTDTLERCYNEAQRSGSAVPVVDIEDSLRIITNNENSVFDRNLIKRVQTPQVFHGEKIIKAYESCLDTRVTDDASVYESYFGQVSLVEGNRENVKITYPADLKYAELFLKKED